jgi:transposase InsO family protein
MQSLISEGWDAVESLLQCYEHGVALCRMFNQAIAGQGLPVRLSLDHVPLFRFERWQANLRILEIETIRTVPQVPASHPFVERLIGTIRREYLDAVLFWNGRDLGQNLAAFRNYSNDYRVHQGLDGDTPGERADSQRPARPASFQNYTWQPHCNGFFDLPIAT